MAMFAPFVIFLLLVSFLTLFTFSVGIKLFYLLYFCLQLCENLSYDFKKANDIEFTAGHFFVLPDLFLLKHIVACDKVAFFQINEY
jgi:hypothetical protein